MRYKFDGVVLDSGRAERVWEEDSTDDQGTENQNDHEMLYLSSKGRYWIESWSDSQGSCPSARVVTDKEAATWLLLNGYDPDDDTIPPDLRALMAEIVE
jgi:hypothetical protein